MKTKVYSITTIAMTLGALSAPAMAQDVRTAETNGNETNTPNSNFPSEETPVHKTLGYLSSRFNQVGLSALISGLQGDKRVHHFMAAFDAEGALKYNQEFTVKDHFDKDGNLIEAAPRVQNDRTQGVQLVKYSVSALSNGKGFVSVDLFSFKNTDFREPVIASKGNEGGMRILNKFPELLSQADVLGFEWDSQYTYNNLMTRKIKLADATVALPLHQNYAHTRMLALVAGGGVAFTHSRVGLDDGRTIDIGSAQGVDGSGFALNPSVHYGIQYDQYSRRRNGNHFQAKLEMKHDWIPSGSFRDVKDTAFLANLKQYDLDEAQYKEGFIEHGVPFPGHCHEVLPNNAEPVKPSAPNNRIDMASVVFSPSVTYEFDTGTHGSKGKGKSSRLPVRTSRYGFTAGANFALESDYDGGSVNQNQISNLNNRYFFKIFKIIK